MLRNSVVIYFNEIRLQLLEDMAGDDKGLIERNPPSQDSKLLAPLKWVRVKSEAFQNSGLRAD